MSNGFIFNEKKPSSEKLDFWIERDEDWQNNSKNKDQDTVAIQSFSFENTTVYKVQKGDTLDSIALKFYTTVEKIKELNPGLNQGDKLKPGKKIIVPYFHSMDYVRAPAEDQFVKYRLDLFKRKEEVSEESKEKKQRVPKIKKEKKSRDERKKIKENKQIVKSFIHQAEETVIRLEEANAAAEYLDSIIDLIGLYKSELNDKESDFNWGVDGVLEEFKNRVVTEEVGDNLMMDLFYLKDKFPAERKNLDSITNFADRIKPIPVRPVTLIPVIRKEPELLMPITYKPSQEMKDKWEGMTAEQIVKDNGWDWEEVKKIFYVYPNDTSGTKAGCYAFIKQKIMDGWRPADGTPEIRSWKDESGMLIIEAWKFDLVRKFAREDLGIAPDTGIYFRWYKSYYTPEQNKAAKRNLFTVSDKPLAHEADFKKAQIFEVPFKGDFWDFHDQYGTFDNYVKQVMFDSRQNNPKEFAVFDQDKNPTTVEYGIVKNRNNGNEGEGVRLRKSPYRKADGEIEEGGDNVIRWLTFNERVFIKGYSEEHKWYLVETEHGEIGYAGSIYIDTKMPEPGARYYVVKVGDTLLDIARKFYAQEGDQRNFVAEIVNMNKGAGIYTDEENESIDISKARQERLDFIKANDGIDINNWSKFKVKYDFLIWIPSKEYAKQQIESKMPDQRFGGSPYTPMMLDEFVRYIDVMKNGTREPYEETSSGRSEITNKIANNWYQSVWPDYRGIRKRDWYDATWGFWSGMGLSTPQLVTDGWAEYEKQKRLQIETEEQAYFYKEILAELEGGDPEKEVTDKEVRDEGLEKIKGEMMATWFTEKENKAMGVLEELTTNYNEGIAQLVEAKQVTLDEMMGPGAASIVWKDRIKMLNDQTVYNKIVELENKAKNLTGSEKLLYHPLTKEPMEKAEQDEDYDSFVNKLRSKESEIASKKYTENIEDMLLGAYVRFKRADRNMDVKHTYYNTDVWGKSYGTPYVYSPRETIPWGTPGRDEALKTREIYYDVKAELLVLAKAYYLNVDPGGLERTGFWGSMWEGFAESTFWTDWETNTDFIEQFAQAAADHGVPLSKTQKDRLQKTFWEKAGAAIGAAIPEMFKIVVSALVTEGLGAIPAIGRAAMVLESAIVARFGRYGPRIYKALSASIREMTTFTIAGAGAWSGLGEGMAQGLFSAVNPFKFRGIFGILFNSMFKVATGALSETVAEFSGQYVENLITSGFQFKKAFTDTFGRDFDEFNDKLLVTVFVSTMFSSAANVKLFKNLKLEVENNKKLDTTDKNKALELLQIAIDTAGGDTPQSMLDEAKNMAEALQLGITDYWTLHSREASPEVADIELKLLNVHTNMEANPEQALNDIAELNQRFEPYRRIHEELSNIQEKGGKLDEDGLIAIYGDIAKLRAEMQAHKNRKLSTYGFKMVSGIAASVILPIPPQLVNLIVKVGAKVYHLVSIQGKITYKKWQARMMAENLGIDFDDPKMQDLLKRCYDSYTRGDIVVDEYTGDTSVKVNENLVMADETPIDAEKLRNSPGEVTGTGIEITGNWLRGKQANAGLFPKSVADKLRGKKFNNFDEFREAFWKAVAEEPSLIEGFSQNNIELMKKGFAPFAIEEQHLGGQKKYILHHKIPIQHGGGVYDVDNIMIVTPRYHKDVLDPSYHY